MTSKVNVNRALDEATEALLGDLSTLERVRLFAKAAAQNNDAWIEKLWETAPRETYEMVGLEAMVGARTLFLLSMFANSELARLGTELRVHEIERDQSVALVLLNEALSRLSDGGFDVDEYGSTEISESWPDRYGSQCDPTVSKLATKCQELWDATALEFAVPEAERSRPYFPELAASALLGYRGDLSDEAFDDLPPFTHSEVYLAEVRLLRAAVGFYRSLHMWRILAENHIGISLDEFLDITQVKEERVEVFGPSGRRQLDEEQCERTMSLYQLYLDAYEDVLGALCAHYREEFDGVPDLDTQAEENAAELAASIDLLS